MFPFKNLNDSIDSIYKQLLETITREQKVREVSNELLNMSSNYNRVLYVFGILKEKDMVPLVMKENKCEYASTHYRNLGNMFYKQVDLFKAWQYYNLALMYSPLLAPSYCMAVANRSAVLAAMKEYQASIDDIELVFTLKYPENLRDKLLKRKKICEDALKAVRTPNSQELEDDIFALRSLNHPKYVDASCKLEVMHTPQMGRHVIAKEDINVGEVIVQEEPFVRVLLKSQYHIACAYCFSRKFNLYPCPYCVVTMYCSRKCVNQAWDEYHSYECLLGASLMQSNFTKLELLALRATIKARCQHPKWNDVLDLATRVHLLNEPENLGCSLVNGKLVYSSKYYSSIHTLATNLEKRDISDIFQKTVTAAVLMNYLCVANFFESEDPTILKKIVIFVADTLLLHLMTAPTNMHGITTNVEDVDGNFIEEYNIGGGAYPFLSLINHSCAPNVVRYQKLGTSQVTLIALRPIKKGMQLFDNYGAHHGVHSKEDRHAILRSQYKFTCICEACVDDWPTYHTLKTIPNLPNFIVNMKNKYLKGEIIEALQKADKERALKIYWPLCQLATALESYVPCKEAADCQEALKQCLAIIGGVLPHGYSRFIEWKVPAPRNPDEPGSTRFYISNTFRDILNRL